MHAELATEIDHGEEQVAQLLLEQWIGDAVARGRRAARDFSAHLRQLLLDLLRRPLRIGPIEADTGGAILKAERAMQGGEVRRQSVHDARALARLHPLPALAFTALVQMRMTRLHLVEETFRDVAEVERPALLGDHAVKEHLEQQV